MRDVGSRYSDVYVAAQQDKWEYSEYQAKKIKVLLEQTKLANPAAQKDTQEFLAEAYPAIVDAIKTKDKEQFEAGYGKFNSLCNTCHSSQNVAYLQLVIPTTSSSPILEGKPADGGGGGGDSGGGGGADKATVEKACTDCHDLERVKSAAYQGDQWKDVVNRMKGKGAPIQDSEIDAFAKYLDESKGLKEEAAGGGGGGGDDSGGASAGGGGSVDKATVEKTCSDCHGTDQIKSAAYKGAQWKDLVTRMKGKGAPVDDVDAYADFLDKSEGLKK